MKASTGLPTSSSLRIVVTSASASALTCMVRTNVGSGDGGHRKDQGKTNTFLLVLNDDLLSVNIYDVLA